MKKLLLIVCVVFCSVFAVSAQQTADKAAKTKLSLKSIDWSPKYKGEINVGYTVAGEKFRFDYYAENSYGAYSYGTNGTYVTDFSRPLFETIHGVDIGPYFFVGAGVGLQYYCGKLKEFHYLADTAAAIYETKKANRWNAIMVPIFADLKFMYPTSKEFTPYLNLGLGGTIGCYSSVNYNEVESSTLNGVKNSFANELKTRGGLYCDFGAGFRYKLLNFSLGLQHQIIKLDFRYEETVDGKGYYSKKVNQTAINSFYAKIGINF